MRLLQEGDVGSSELQHRLVRIPSSRAADWLVPELEGGVGRAEHEHRLKRAHITNGKWICLFWTQCACAAAAQRLGKPLRARHALMHTIVHAADTAWSDKSSTHSMPSYP
eukprot:1160189-Pelagomonas_calceolata.AAC.6